ncbi:type II toxin-antitoxin system RelB/DinJ family antitoxin [Weissella diestrammenae]|uniref:Type II toxin-antitoxin system RelB/DinJ family antitoxin n=1 Tax=Weissella diestrammenae TaxID=1162633 RepID=A0A7G9T3V4_9LACO|nr:type II toxin-antitoxin system RelB/DinJ family antitoxin [Weissella diestrammenae]MCM0582767.1 type II toxin-antitoxin system RelB/DinJ family antitoxin [Weissella diestrammenae]QNN74779.1 type II toxin-antitoxin system RelB/DinJ family antitoxin [Weissella diestrammenae]
MNEKLIQLRVEEVIKDRADDVFKSQGLSTQSALKIFLTQVAMTGDSPFNGLFVSTKK